MLFSDSKEGESEEVANESSVRAPLKKFEIENIQSQQNIQGGRNELKKEKENPTKTNINSLSETTCNSRNSSKKVLISVIKTSLKANFHGGSVPRTPFSNYSPIEYISPPPNLSKMNSSSRLLFCEESALKSCSSIMSERNEETKDVGSFFTENKFQKPVQKGNYITPQPAKLMKTQNCFSVPKQMKSSQPFVPKENPILSNNMFIGFQKPVPNNDKKEIGVIMSRKEDLTKYEIKEDTINEDGRTSLMIKNIPNKYTKEMIVDILDISFYQRYDFFYLPIDFKVSLYHNSRIAAMLGMPLSIF